MARIEDCNLGTRAKFTDGWGGPASIVARRMNNCAEGSLAEVPNEGTVERNFPDAVLMRFEAPVEDGANHKILAVMCPPDDLTLI